MTTFREQQIIDLATAELERRQNALQSVLDIVEVAAVIPWQKRFLRDPTSNKALFGERRGAKSTTMAIQAIDRCLTIPFAKVLYIGLTQDSVKQVMYDEILARILRTYNIQAKLVGGDQCVFTNGSIIYLRGLDANKKQKERVRGIKSSLNIIDEMQSFTQDTQLILNEILGPSTADTLAPTTIGGTAGDDIGENYWREITIDNTKANPIGYSKQHPEWLVYRCSWEDNIAIDELTGNRVCDNVEWDKLEEEYNEIYNKLIILKE